LYLFSLNQALSELAKLKLAVIFFSCKTENKQKVVYADAIIKTNNTVVIDFEAFNEAKFIGKTYQYLDEFNEFKDCRLWWL
jgi:hypothetical protein